MVTRKDGLSVDEPAVYAGGRRRRLFAAAGAAALAIAGAIGLLAPRATNDTLPALGPTVTPTPEATSTSTSMTSPSATVTSSAGVTVTSTSTPSATTTRTPTSTPQRAVSTSTPQATPTTATGPGWSEPVTVAGRTYRARLVPSRGGEHNYDLEMQRGSSTVFTPTSVFNTEGRWGLEEGDPRVGFYLSGSRLIDLISVKGEPVGDEVIGHIAVRTPDGDDVSGEPYADLHVTIFRTTSANTWAPYGPEGWVVRVPDGGVWDLSGD